MNMFLGVVAFCMMNQCAFWKSELYSTKEECEKDTVVMIDKMIEQEMQLVQGVCFPIELGKAT